PFRVLSAFDPRKEGEVLRREVQVVYGLAVLSLLTVYMAIAMTAAVEGIRRAPEYVSRARHEAPAERTTPNRQSAGRTDTAPARADKRRAADSPAPSELSAPGPLAAAPSAIARLFGSLA